MSAAYRAHVDAAVERLIEKVPEAEAERVFAIVEIGLHHEQQHQELLITDILHAFAQNPTDPAYDTEWQQPRATQGPRGYVEVPAGIHAIGHEGEGFCFDNETPFHDELIPHVRIARHLDHECRMARIHRRRRATRRRAMALRWLGHRSDGRLAGARLLANEKMAPGRR